MITIRKRCNRASRPSQILLAATLLLPFSFSTPASAFSDVGTRDLVATGGPIAAEPADPQIAAALGEVSPQRIQSTIEKLVAFHNRSTLSSRDTDMPAGTGITAAAEWIRTQFTEISSACGGCLEVKTDSFVEQPQAGPHPRITQPTPIRNVYAILRGMDPVENKRMYLVTGHYDTRNTDVMDTHGFAPGANDDSSGIAVSLECARVLSKHRFPATLVFVAVAGEEQGLNGSKHLAELARSEGWDLQGVLNNDIVGGDTTPGDKLQDKSLVRVFSEPVPANATPEETKRILALGADSDSPSRELAREVAAVGRTYFGPGNALRTHKAATEPSFRPVLEMRLDRYLRGGDHSSFNQQGFAAVRFTEWRENFNHQHQNVRTENGVEYGDLLEFDDFGYIAQVARLNAATLATLASSPGEPREVRVVTTNLDNNSTLKWKPPPSGAAQADAHASIRYEVVWRETAAPDWQNALHDARQGEHFQGNSTGAQAAEYAVTLPVSKDNVIFGVRACDGAGHCSQAVTPVPER